MTPFHKTDKYQQIPCVVYFRLEPGKRPARRNYVCFGGMREERPPTAIRYIAPIKRDLVYPRDGKLADGSVEFYVQFLKHILARPESPKLLIKKLKETVHFRLNTKGLNYYRALFFLTWFRYVHHYPEIIHALFVERKENESLEDTFKRFQDIHNRVSAGKFQVTSQAFANESIIYHWGGKGDLISLEKLWANMERASKFEMGVQACLK